MPLFFKLITSLIYTIYIPSGYSSLVYLMSLAEHNGHLVVLSLKQLCFVITATTLTTTATLTATAFRWDCLSMGFQHVIQPRHHLTTLLLILSQDVLLLESNADVV